MSRAKWIPVQRFDLLCLYTLCEVLRDKAVLLGDKAVLSLERIAILRAGARDWLEAPSAGICYEVPMAYVAQDEDGQGQGMVDDTLVVELLTPGHGQTIQHPEDVFLLPEQPTSAPERRAPDTIDESFLNAIQYAFEAACTLAQRQDVDRRWRLLRGPARQPVITATGESASDQASRAFYGTLTDTWPDAGVIVLAQVTRAGQWHEVAGVGAKTRAIVQAVDGEGIKMAQVSPVRTGAVSDVPVGQIYKRGVSWAPALRRLTWRASSHPASGPTQPP